MVNAHIEQAIRNIEAEREQKIANVRDTIMHEKVAPQNAEIDMKRDKALQELQDKLNLNIAELQTKFNAERQAIIDACEKQKTENENRIVNVETASIIIEYDTKLAQLRKLSRG